MKITTEQVKVIIVTICVSMLFTGSLFLFIGDNTYRQGSPQLAVECKINWAGTNEYGQYYNITSTPLNHTDSARLNINGILEGDSYFFKITHNKGKNKDPLEVKIKISVIDGTPYVVSYNVKTNYAREEETSLQEELPFTKNGTGHDTKSDWRDIWFFQVFEWGPAKNDSNMLIGHSLFVSGLILFLLILVTCIIIIILVLTSLFGIFEKINIEVNWYKDRDLQFWIDGITDVSKRFWIILSLVQLLVSVFVLSQYFV